MTGIFSTKFENRSLGIAVNEDYSHTIHADFTANFSGPFNVYTDNEGNLDSLNFDDDYFTSFNAFASIENRGFGLDLGATYKLLNDKVLVSAALTDLGYVRWRRDATNLSAKGQFVFDGLVQNHRADNFGAGLAFRAGIFQFYFISDRIPVSWDKLKLDESSSVVVPANWNTFNLRLGMNLTFGNKVRKKDDKPMIQNEQTF
ncbi:MAG: hypothetical protein HZB98_13790 [Bacteroidia bacterium]|nr:hypothetical protein [Bacteroidia bacterium]